MPITKILQKRVEKSGVISIMIVDARKRFLEDTDHLLCKFSVSFYTH